MGRLIITSQLKLWLSWVTTWLDRRLHYVRSEILGDLRYDCIVESVKLLFFFFHQLTIAKRTPNPISKMSNVYQIIVMHLHKQSQTLPAPPAEKSDCEAWARDFLKFLVSCWKSSHPPIDMSIGALPSVQICVRYEDNIVTKCCLRRSSGCPADYTLYMM